MGTTYDPVTQTEYHDLPFMPENGGLALPWFSATELLGIEPTEIPWLVHELIPAETINLLIGSPGTGKSFLALDLAICVVLGRPFLGRQVRQGKVMYLAAEDGWRRVSRRLGQWVEANHTPRESLQELWIMPTAIQIAAGASYGDESGGLARAWAALQDDVRRIDPVLVVLDPLAELHTGLAENAAEEMNPLMRALRKLVRGQDRTMMVVHHDKKGVLEPSVYSGRGSGAIAGAVDGVYHAVAAEVSGETTKIALHITKGRDLPPELKKPQGYRMEGLHWYPDDSVRPSRESKLIEQNREWYAWLGQQPRPVTIDQARAAFGVSYNTAKDVLRRLVERRAALTDAGRPEQFTPIPAAGDRLV